MVEKASNLAPTSIRPEEDNDQAFVERLKILVSQEGGVSALAKKSGISISGIQRYLAGGEPTRKFLLALAKAADVRLDWLLAGEGGMFATPMKTVTLALVDARCIDDPYVQGPSWCNNDMSFINLPPELFKQAGVDPNDLYALAVDGDSMEGALANGDYALFDAKSKAFDADGIYVVRLNNRLVARRLQADFDGALRIVCTNKAYSDVVVPKDRLGELEIAGRVVWAVCKMF